MFELINSTDYVVNGKLCNDYMTGMSFFVACISVNV